MLSIPPF